MSAPYRYKCPITGREIQVYECKDAQGKATGKYGIARYKGGSVDPWEYMHEDMSWRTTYFQFANVSAATLKLEDWLARQPFPDNRPIDPKEVAMSEPVIPLEHDMNYVRIKFKCPVCGMKHITQIRTDNWPEVVQLIERRCPKVEAPKFQIKLWETYKPTSKSPEQKKWLGVQADLTALPIWDCKECFATGEYVGFVKVEKCKTCFTKT